VLNMNILAVIPARGGSKGIPNKNIALLGGRPLISYTINAAREAKSVERLVVSTDDERIANISASFGAEVIIRPFELAADNSPTLPVIQHAVAQLARLNYSAAAVMTLQPTSPLRTSRHIDEAARLFCSDPNADSLVSCIDVPHIFHPRSVMRKNKDGYLEQYLQQEIITRRQDKDHVLARNGAAIYITRASKIDQYIFGGRLLPFTMTPEDSIDIDSMNDIHEAEYILARIKKNEKYWFN